MLVEAAACTQVRLSFLLIPNMPIWDVTYMRVFISIVQYEISVFQIPSAAYIIFVKVRGAANKRFRLLRKVLRYMDNTYTEKGNRVKRKSWLPPE